MFARCRLVVLLTLLVAIWRPIAVAAQAPSASDDALAPWAPLAASGVSSAASSGPADRAALGGMLAGRVTDRAGAPLVGVVVTAAAALRGSADEVDTDVLVGEDDLAPAGRTRTGPDGAYSLVGLPSGQIWLRFSDPDGRWLPAYLGDAHRFRDALPMVLASGATVTGVDEVLDAGGWITGRVVGAITPADGAVTAGVQVAAFRADAATPFATTLADGLGKYRFGPLPPGDYRLVVLGADGDGAERWRAADTAGDAAGISLADGVRIEAPDLAPNGVPWANDGFAGEGAAVR